MLMTRWFAEDCWWKTHTISYWPNWKF